MAELIRIFLGIAVTFAALWLWAGFYVFYKRSVSPMQGTILQLFTLTMTGISLLLGAAWWTILVAAAFWLGTFYFGLWPAFFSPGIGHALSYVHSFLVALFFGWHLSIVRDWPLHQTLSGAWLAVFALMGIAHFVADIAKSKDSRIEGPFTPISLSAPYSLIACCALVGILLKGWTGLLVGGIAGFGLAMTVGLAASLASGGYLPRKVRREAAQAFLAGHSELARKAFPQNTDAENLGRIERLIDSFFSKSASKATPFSPTVGLSRQEVQIAVQELIKSAEGYDAKTLIEALWNHMEITMYPPKEFG